MARAHVRRVFSTRCKRERLRPILEGEIAMETIATECQALVPVPNGTGLLPLDRLVEQYQTFARQTVEGIVMMGVTVLAAETLGPQRLEEFCERVKVDRKGSSFRKLRAIGHAAQRFEPLIERLPNNWTTLYQLAQLPPAQLEEVSQDDRFCSIMTAKDLRSIQSEPIPNPVSFTKDIFIDVSEVKDLVLLFEKLDELKDDLGIQYRTRGGIQKANYRRKSDRESPTSVH
jgi:hypothetical protein